jgi:tetratricopeptide (TPR) repeat protein
VSAVISDGSSSLTIKPIVVFGAVGLALALRLAHLSSASLSPLSYQPGPDEEYYLRFGEAVAAGQGQYSPEFTFMDPAYGYLLGAVFKLLGVNLFAVYALQCLLDTATAYGIFVIGRALGRPRAGLYGALLYGMTSVAIMFCVTLLKEVWVTAFVTWWVAAALSVIRSERKLAWAAFGVYCGVGIGLRSTLMLMTLVAFCLPFVGASLLGREFAARGLAVGESATRESVPRGLANRAAKSALMACGVVLALAPWSLRNHHAYGSFSPLPHNGGVVLHQLYNEKNPDSAIWIPDFVNYLEPSEIWRGYAQEASKRQGRAFSPPEVDRYWKAQALRYIQEHPAGVLEDMWQKTLKFFASTEIPINRSLVEESMFSPVLKLLPAPAPWLLAMGVAGLVGLAFKDRRWPIIALPVFIASVTVAVFFAEDRFRFHAMTMLALCSGIWIDLIARNIRAHRKRQVLVFGAMAGLIGAASVALGRVNPPAAVRWDHIVWGYIKMGKIPEARAIAERVASEQPGNEPILEALGYTAIARGQYGEAAQDYRRALEVRPQSHIAHYNLAKVYLELGDREQAAAEAETAVRLYPSADYKALLEQIKARQ